MIWTIVIVLIALSVLGYLLNRCFPNKAPRCPRCDKWLWYDEEGKPLECGCGTTDASGLPMPPRPYLLREDKSEESDRRYF